ncbi:substrate-binding domain-containing protein [Pikeienuella sp. HZG-20]|uniref:substrate-binding domain-containing protein n=1 Tax=Paludibacillus litoralis TaxID=3133267 RepID=UPI0030ED09A3
MTMRFGPIPPDFTDKRVIDRHMDAAGLSGVSRRDFLAFSTAAAGAMVTASALGLPGMAIADQSGKIAHLMMTLRLEYVVNADAGAQGAAKALGLEHSAVDGQLDSGRQLDQFEQQTTAGANAVMLHAPGGGSIKRIAQLANENKVWLANTWGTLPWFTPYEAGDYWTLYAVPEEYSAHRDVTREVCKAVMAAFGGGEVVGVTGVEGNTVDLIRSRGRDAAIAEFPEISLAGELPGKWNREDSQKAMEDLISRHPDLKGVIAQNDDVADGCIAALRAAGYRPGEDVFICGADGTSGGAEMIKRGLLLATSANVPQYMGALLTTRLYDVMNGWEPRASERMMNWRSTAMTAENVDIYLSRYVENGDVEPFDYKKMSKVEHPDDWDPQAELFPMDLDLEWSGIDKPEGWSEPEAYRKAREDGEAEAVAAEYAEHYKTPMFGPSPNA